jgi:hypothetical protein
MRDKKPTHCYIGRAWCGCVLAITTDRGDKHTAQSVAEFIKDGMTVERIPYFDGRLDAIVNFDCKHGDKPSAEPEQLPLFNVL